MILNLTWTGVFVKNLFILHFIDRLVCPPINIGVTNSTGLLFDFRWPYLIGFNIKAQSKQACSGINRAQRRKIAAQTRNPGPPYTEDRYPNKKT
jgi:hypothetical protein